MADDNNNNTNDTAGGTATFTAGETKVMLCLLKHLKGDITADFDAAATELNYKDASVLKTKWSQIKRKILGGASAPAGAKKGTPKKRKAAEDGNNDDEETPKPKRVRKPKKAKDEEMEVIRKEEVGEDPFNAMETTEAVEGGTVQEV